MITVYVPTSIYSLIQELDEARAEAGGWSNSTIRGLRATVCKTLAKANNCRMTKNILSFFDISTKIRGMGSILSRERGRTDFSRILDHWSQFSRKGRDFVLANPYTPNYDEHVEKGLYSNPLLRKCGIGIVKTPFPSIYNGWTTQILIYRAGPNYITMKQYWEFEEGVPLPFEDLTFEEVDA